MAGVWLDVKLAFRMIAKYPGLTVVGGAAMAFGLAAGVGMFELRTKLVDPSIPLDDGARIVGLRLWDAARNVPRPSTREDFAAWREHVTLVDEVSAFIPFSRNLMTDDGQSGIEAVAAMSEAAFRVARVPPVLGRTFLEADTRAGALPVAVVGHDLWTRRFGADPAVLGRTIRLGNERPIVIGVMPEGFAFPAVHNLWVPLTDGGAAAPDGPGVRVFGRLAPGASMKQAQDELSATLGRTAARTPESQHLRPQVVPYAWLTADPGGVQLGLALGNAFVLMLLLLVSANVALLMFTRTSTRETEIAVRSALGAGRGRLVAQIFIEALALASFGVAVGIGAARLGLRSFLRMYELDSGRTLPFWVTDSLTPAALAYAGGLTILVASIIGVVPTLKLTGRGVQDRLRQSSAGGGGPRFGGIWTAVIAAQVAATLLFPAAAMFFHRWVISGQTRDLGFASERFLSARLEWDSGLEDGSSSDRTDARLRADRARAFALLEPRLLAESEVAGLTFADRLPGMLHQHWRVEIEGEAAAPAAENAPVAVASVAVNFFDVFGAPILAGRGFTTADLARPGAVIVNQSFARLVPGGVNPIGRRIRPVSADANEAPGRWLEIVGLVRDLGMSEQGAGVYRPASLATVPELRLALGINGDRQSFMPRLRAVASEADPGLVFHDVQPIEDAGASQWLESQYLSRLLVVLSAIALTLSLAAIYSVMAVTVSRRSREIGLRMALGADPPRVVAVVLRQPLVQVGVGVVCGAILVALFFSGLYQTVPTLREVLLIVGYAMAMMCVCLLACVLPTRRALRIEVARILSFDA
jgi:predicted permease